MDFRVQGRPSTATGRYNLIFGGKSPMKCKIVWDLYVFKIFFLTFFSVNKSKSHRQTNLTLG